MRKELLLCLLFLAFCPSVTALCCITGAYAGCYPAANCCAWDGHGFVGCQHAVGPGGYSCHTDLLIDGDENDCLVCFCTDESTCAFTEGSCGACSQCNYDDINLPSWSRCDRTHDCIANPCLNIGEDNGTGCCYGLDLFDNDKSGSCCEETDGAVCSGVCITTPTTVSCQAGVGWACDGNEVGDANQDGCCYNVTGICATDPDHCVYDPVPYTCDAGSGWVCDNPVEGVNYDGTRPNNCWHYNGTCPGQLCEYHAQCTGNQCGGTGWSCFNDENDVPCIINCIDCDQNTLCDSTETDSDGDGRIDGCDNFPNNNCSIDVEDDNCGGTGCPVDYDSSHYCSECQPDDDSDGVNDCFDICLGTSAPCVINVGVDANGCPLDCLDPNCAGDPACQCATCSDCSFPCSFIFCTTGCGGQPCWWEDTLGPGGTCDSCGSGGAPTVCDDYDNEDMCELESCGVGDSPCVWREYFLAADKCLSCTHGDAPADCESYDDQQTCNIDPCNFASYMPGGCMWTGSCETDFDGDGIEDSNDNCPSDPNPGQENADGDAWGDVCEYCDNEPTLWTPDEPGQELTCVGGVDNDCDDSVDCADGDCAPLVACGGTHPDPCVDPYEWVSSDGTELCDEGNVIQCTGDLLCDQRWVGSNMYFCNGTDWINYAVCVSTARCQNGVYFMDDGDSGCILDPNCGNGALDVGEQCDGPNWGSITGCSDFDSFSGGVLVCGADCQFDTNACTGGPGGSCGDNVIDQGEQCDTLNLGAVSDCTDLGTFTTGTVSCDASCQYDTSQCSRGSDDDSDGDGIPDWQDPDDDNDGIPDIEDPDQGGSDPGCLYDPLSPATWNCRDDDNDLDNDGIINELDDDRDGDGLDNDVDADDDNDGVPDDGDVDDDNDGIVDPSDKDVNNDWDDDGLDNGLDNDDDGDGIPDDVDDDDDNDGLPDWVDDDDDNDGIPDVDDPDNGGTDDLCVYLPWNPATYHCLDNDNDLDNDGIINELDDDRDGDGLDNDVDADDDNDGVPDDGDVDDDNDGIVDPSDKDVNNDWDDDGLDNGLDNDDDGDGIPDDVDDDDDNDGLPDWLDDDDDNDGLPDSIDPDNQPNIGYCGDGTIDAGEQCEGLDFCGLFCPDFGFSGGSLGCSGCVIDTSGCTGGSVGACGNNEVNTGEQCDGTDWAQISGCSDFDDFGSGTLVCGADCQFDTSACMGGGGSFCGDGTIDQGEQCDGTNWGTVVDCTDLGSYLAGTPACGPDCRFDTDTCVGSPGGLCGDGTIDAGEQCDGLSWGPVEGCTDFGGYTGGSLSCGAECDFDTSACTHVDGSTCGDLVISGGEQCDGNNWGPVEGCSDFSGFIGGVLVCGADCEFDTTACFGASGQTCGDGTIDQGEHCDGAAMGAATSCTDFDAFAGGTIGCGADCRYDTSGCTGGPGSWCGDGTIDAGEQCDGADWGAVSGCSDFDYFGAGTLNCVDCQFDTTLCRVSVFGGDPDGDGDGDPDFTDDDDDNDGTPDIEDPDQGGSDPGCVYDPLNPATYHCRDDDNDLDNDGTQNELDDDIDGDGFYNWNDPDDDNDGVPDDGDVDDDNDGIPDYLDYDVFGDNDWDNDGVDNGADIDIDGDGILNDVDDDDDNDGLPDWLDDDDDNDGIPDTVDPDAYEPGYGGAYCGDGTIDRSEQCDSLAWGPVTGCVDFGGFTGGALVCGADCQFDTSACTGGSGSWCGDGTIDQGEHCDGNNWGPVHYCTDIGAYAGGLIRCGRDCRFDTRRCITAGGDECGDAALNAGEQCDGGVGSWDCRSFDSFSGGTLICSDCMFDTASCTTYESYDTDGSPDMCERLFAGMQGVCDYEGETGCWDAVSLSATYGKCCGDDYASDTWPDGQKLACETGSFCIDADCSFLICDAILNMGNCDTHGKTVCWDVTRCCGDDLGENWTYSSSTSIDDLIVPETCYRGTWYSRVSGNVTYYSLVI